MITLIEKTSPFFDYAQARQKFELNRDKLQDSNGFPKILSGSRFFNIYHHGYVGSIFVYEAQDGKNYIGGYAGRKHHQDVVEAISRVAALFDELWAHTTHLDAVIALKKAGFEWASRKKKLLKNKRKEKNMSTTNKIKASPQTFSSAGMYGSATTSKKGTTYDPSAFERELLGITKNNIPQYLNQLTDPTYDSQIFKAQSKQRQRLAKQSFENNLMNPLASRGLTRGSSVNQMSNQFANKLADLEVDAMANEDTRTTNILNNLMSYYQVPYNMMTGMATLSNNAYQHALQNQMLQNQQRYNQLMDYAKLLGGAYGMPQTQGSSGQNLGGLLGSGLGGYFGGPLGMQFGNALGGMFGGIFG